MDGPMMGMISPVSDLRPTRKYGAAHVHIRAARPEDRTAIIANINAVCAEGIFLQTDHFVETASWRRAFSNNVNSEMSRHLLAVVEAEDHVVGHGRLFPNGYGSKDQHVGNVGLALLPSFRNHGVGARLLSYLVDWATNKQFRKLYVEIIASNVRAVRLFREHGFVQEGTLNRQLLVNETYVDEILMARFLNNNDS